MGGQVGLHQSSVLGRDVVSFYQEGRKKRDSGGGDGRWGRGAEKDLIMQMIKAAAMEVEKANYESCCRKCWMLISSGFGGGEQGPSIG